MGLPHTIRLKVGIEGRGEGGGITADVLVWGRAANIRGGSGGQVLMLKGDSTGGGGGGGELILEVWGLLLMEWYGDLLMSGGKWFGGY